MSARFVQLCSDSVPTPCPVPSVFEEGSGEPTKVRPASFPGLDADHAWKVGPTLIEHWGCTWGFFGEVLGCRLERRGRLAGRSVAVIGASSGLGWAVAEAAAREGASLTVAARRAARLTTLQERSGGDVLAIACDVTVDGDCERVIDESIKRYGRLDALIYSAGVSPLGPVATTSSAEWADSSGSTSQGQQSASGRRPPICGRRMDESSLCRPYLPTG